VLIVYIVARCCRAQQKKEKNKEGKGEGREREGEKKKVYQQSAPTVPRPGHPAAKSSSGERQAL